MEVQRLLTRHRSELAAAQEQAAADAARQVDALRAHHEQDTRMLRERLAKVGHDSNALPVRCQLARHGALARVRNASPRKREG